MIPLKRILLVEDNPNDAELTLEALGEHNLANEVTWVHDGAEALDYLFCRGAYAGHPCNDLAVILLDLKLPKVDGLEVLRSIKADKRLKLIPVVILTSPREERELGAGFRSGDYAIVVKPVAHQEFI